MITVDQVLETNSSTFTQNIGILSGFHKSKQGQLFLSINGLIFLSLPLEPKCFYFSSEVLRVETYNINNQALPIQVWETRVQRTFAQSKLTKCINSVQCCLKKIKTPAKQMSQMLLFTGIFIKTGKPGTSLLLGQRKNTPQSIFCVPSLS